MSEINAYNKESIIHEAKQSRGALSPPEIPYFTRGLKTSTGFLYFMDFPRSTKTQSLFVQSSAQQVAY